MKEYKYRIYVAGIILEVKNICEYSALHNTELFEHVDHLDHFLTCEHDDVRIYSVKLNGKRQIAVVKRIENESPNHQTQKGGVVYEWIQKQAHP